VTRQDEVKLLHCSGVQNMSVYQCELWLLRNYSLTHPTKVNMWI